MAFFGQGGGAAPGAARNSMANYPPRGTGFAGTKPSMAAPNRYGAATPAYGAANPAYGAANPGASTGQGQLGVGVPAPSMAPQTIGTGGNSINGVASNMKNSVNDASSFTNNGSGAGAGQGGGYRGAGVGDNVGGQRQFRQLRRQMNRSSGAMEGDTTDMTMGDPPSSGDTTNPTPSMPPSDGPNQQWRADRRKAMRQGLVEQTADGGYTSTQPADPNGQGAKRDGMGWRAERRQAVKDGTYTPPTGANRNGFGYRQDRRQAARRAANMPPAKPGQPPAM